MVSYTVLVLSIGAAALISAVLTGFGFTLRMLADEAERSQNLERKLDEVREQVLREAKQEQVDLLAVLEDVLKVNAYEDIDLA